MTGLLPARQHGTVGGGPPTTRGTKKNSPNSGLLPPHSALPAQMDSKHSSPELQEAIRLLGEMGQRLERSAREQTLLEERVGRLENSIVFQILRKIGI